MCVQSNYKEIFIFLESMYQKYLTEKLLLYLVSCASNSNERLIFYHLCECSICVKNYVKKIEYIKHISASSKHLFSQNIYLFKYFIYTECPVLIDHP